MEVFIDYGVQTQETQDKWRTRREKEVRDEELNMIPGIQLIIGQLFQKAGYKVHYSEVDNDDTLAAYAQSYGADILSADKDFMRYRNRSYKIYCDFEIEKGKLKLIPKNEFKYLAQVAIDRDLMLDPLPLTYNTYPSLERIQKHLIHYRGTSSPLTRRFGNPQGKIIKLKSHVYHTYGIKEPVNEIYPEWDTKKNKVVWIDEFNKPQDQVQEVDDLLKDPLKYLPDMLRGIERPKRVQNQLWFNHLYGCCYSIIEYHCVIFNKQILEILEQLKKILIKEGFKLDKAADEEIKIQEQLNSKQSCAKCGKTFQLSQKEIQQFKKNNIKMSANCQSCLYKK
ncbi:UNKNOWN [Stylonychia lemnae]|uniref:Uncharacterized protein n=1 Tax=Stylonychia lemnae TaxID=5949 RepID=A0A078AJC1_STYLE|nr:UNKNOWN [Stylonychia lemnae]|eukprot:CDW82415.1 UNKNOWN [Stylonychia lemnae]